MFDKIHLWKWKHHMAEPEKLTMNGGYDGICHELV